MKTRAFEYLMSKLVAWRMERMQEEEEDALKTFDRLKAMKLLFLASAVLAREGEGQDGLLDIFDEFHAMPYGQVEVAVYKAMVNPELHKMYQIKLTTVKRDVAAGYFDGLEDAVKERIKASVEELKRRNADLIKLDSFQLVDLTHEWYSWKATFRLAGLMNKKSLPISRAVIKKERKILSID